MIKGQIIKATGGLYIVQTPEGELWNCKPRGLFRKTGMTPYVGDYVQVDPQENQTGVIVDVKERTNFLVRPPVANLDLMVAVVSTDDPRPNFFTLDKYLAVMHNQQVPTLLAITKPDLAQSDPLVQMYTQVGYSVFVVNPLTGEGAKELREFLGSRLCAFSGNTGTGKSSLLNALEPSLELEVGETSKKLGRGRHTTRHVEIFELEDGLRIADTPGFSSMDIVQTADIDRDTLAHHFIDFSEYIPRCRFNDCKHIKEIGCAVRQAVEQGEILPSRYESYELIFNEIKDVKEWERR